MENISQLKSTAENIIRSKGLNCTATQVAVLMVLLGAGEPLSKRAICESLESVKQSVPQVSLDKATVYRILNRLYEKEIVHRAFLNEKSYKYEPANHCCENYCHPHFRCLDCGSIHCFYDVNVPLLRNLSDGFVFSKQKTMIEGYCPNCSMKAENVQY